MNRNRDALVGVVLIAALALGVFGVLWMQGYAWGVEHQEVEAVFDEVGQIRSGAPVKVRGVRVGQVREIRVDPGGRLVRLHLRVDEAVVLPEDAVVILSPESMFGDWQAEIHPRTRFPHVLYTEPDEPDVLPGYALPDISQLTAEAARISENISVLTDRMGIAFSEETAANVADLIENMQEVTQALSDLVSQQAESFAEVTDEVRAATQGITSAATQAQLTLRRVDDLLARSEVEVALEELAVLAGNLRTLSGEMHGTNREVREMVTRADSTFHQLGGVLTRLEDGEGSLGRLLHDPTAATELEGTLAELQVLLADIRENPRRYLRLSIF